MLGEIDLTQMLRASLNIPYAVGDWNNIFTYTKDGIVQNESYNYLILLDYDHLFFHIGIGINELNSDFSIEIDKLMTKISHQVENISKKDLHGVIIHFTGKIFIATNKASVDLENMKKIFLSRGFSLTVYEIENAKLKVVSEKNIYVPSDYYSDDVIDKKKKVFFRSGNYTIWEHDDGGISYSFHVMQQSDIQTNKEIHASLSLLSPYRDRIDSLVHSKKKERKIRRAECSAIKDTFEGHVKEAIDSLSQLEKKLSNTNFFNNVGFSLLLGFSLLGLLVAIRSLLYVNDIQILDSALWGTIGSFLSIFIPLEYFKKTISYTKMQLSVEVLVRLLTGTVSGLIIYIAIKSNLILGIFNNFENVYVLYLVSMASGWSEKFIPRFMSDVETKIIIADHK
jgi:hypothetical protein